MHLDDILDRLAEHRQRATYGAVAGLIGVPAQSVMSGRPRDARHSWVVNAQTGLPTGYEPQMIDPELHATERVISTPADLEAWIRRRTGAKDAAR